MEQTARSPITLIRKPSVFVLAEMEVDQDGLWSLIEWVREYRPACISADDGDGSVDEALKILTPHGGYRGDAAPAEGEDCPDPDQMLTANELLVELAGRKCCDAETEVLTHSGWVRFPDLRHGAHVATYSSERDRIEFQVPTDYISKRHSGRMYVVDSRAISLRVTDDHNLWAQKMSWRTGGIWGFVQASDVCGTKYRLRRAGIYDGAKGSEFGVPEFLAEATLADWAEFLGYYISEGSIGGGPDYGTGKHIRIYQRPEGIAPIRTCVERLGLNPKFWEDPRNGVQAVVIHNTALANYLSEYGVGSWAKRLPAYVFNWSRGIRGRLLDSLMYGDGHLDRGGHRVYNTCSAGLAEDVQRLIVLRGLPGTISRLSHNQLAVREGEQVLATVNNKARHDSFENVVDEPVYCVTVPNGIIMVRRAGKVCLISNCYNSFGSKAGRKSNKDYIAHTQSGGIPHASIMYHAKMTFFIGDVSRRVSHELIRNYVGADRDEEGSPSQESTRYIEHPGHYVVPPYILAIEDPREREEEAEIYRRNMQLGYYAYLGFIRRREEKFQAATGSTPMGMDRKRIYEAASFYLHHSVSTSWVWTTNPVALAKLFRERCDEAADAEFRRLADAWKAICLERWPNLWPQPWMRPTTEAP